MRHHEICFFQEMERFPLWGFFLRIFLDCGYLWGHSGRFLPAADAGAFHSGKPNP